MSLFDQRDGYYDERGHWQRTKCCYVSCGARCTCTPPNGQWIKPGSPADKRTGLEVAMVDVATCIGCGCDDYHACAGDDGEPCSWIRLDRQAGLGVCSECEEVAKDWDAGSRELQVPTNNSSS